MSLADALVKTLYSKRSAEQVEQLKRRGWDVSSRYLPQAILPKWDEFLSRLTGKPASQRIDFDPVPAAPEGEASILTLAA
jgi:hypothetical protein